jgi:hypothetical protein
MNTPAESAPSETRQETLKISDDVWPIDQIIAYCKQRRKEIAAAQEKIKDVSL